MKSCIVAVSGGVDSVVLLDMLIHDVLPNTNFATFNTQLIVAHFDHGIREESNEDADFVKKLAKKYGLQFELGSANLGRNASEAVAREARYDFMRQCCKKYNTKIIITAHHQDDLIETAIINIIRGTSWRGLTSLVAQSSSHGIVINRPLLQISKNQIINYAQTNKLQWVEDATNLDTRYIRNYIRIKLLPTLMEKEPLFQEKLLSFIHTTEHIKDEINQELDQLLSMYNVPFNSDNQLSHSNYQLLRHKMIMLPDMVAKELIYSILVNLDPDWHPTTKQINRVLHFVKSAPVGKVLQVSKCLHVQVTLRVAKFKKL